MPPLSPQSIAASMTNAIPVYFILRPPGKIPSNIIRVITRYHLKTQLKLVHILKKFVNVL